MREQFQDASLLQMQMRMVCSLGHIVITNPAADDKVLALSMLADCVFEADA